MTVNWHDPARVLADLVALIKLLHFLGGVYIWEFVLNLDFEYSILMEERKLTWTSPRSLLCITALWEHNKCVVAIAFTSWLANFTIYVYSTVKSRGGWTGTICVIQDTFHSNISIFSTLAMDFLLLTLMSVGLLRWKVRSGAIFQLMYAQGLAWVLVVTLAKIPPAVFVVLNLNDPMNMVFQVVGLSIMSIGASRTYRGLVDYPFSNGLQFEAAATNQLREPQRGSFGSS
ncbi:hypothetical protein EDB92DRAFT_1948450 [Lactarius akahatsu]|uniref:Uncharacterized protein n=1 Tax=Lactarius akahatsu TaxID=416441 RepID=A0AAD4QBS3_9AGAM|nr:hypothetical protein EDB92DRAFT_1948450 [Lactarius akahatsu]